MRNGMPRQGQHGLLFIFRRQESPIVFEQCSLTHNFICSSKLIASTFRKHAYPIRKVVMDPNLSGSKE